jgi:ABC-type dipeptide/oligopeptide/nickel transport system permease subunit
MSQSLDDALATGQPDYDFTTEAGIEPARIQGRSPLRLAFDRLRRDRAAMVSLWVVAAIVVIAVAAPLVALISGHGPNVQYRTPDALSPDGLPQPPSGHFWLGTDDQGRDILVRIAYGARVSLAVGIGATLVTITVGVIAGLVSGYFGGIIDTLVARLVDTVLSVPYLLFAVALVAVIGHINLVLLMLVIAAFGWASVARIIRGQVISLREREFVEAARSLGASDLRIMFVDLLPNVIAPAIVFSTLLIPVSVVAEASLSFLGIGIQPPTADWGQMISNAQPYYQVAWWYLVFPGAALLLTTLAFNILGDGVRDAFDPRGDRLMLAWRRKS